jgi:hypothetical protein
VSVASGREPRLGVLTVSSDRALLVVATDGELAVGLREHLDRAMVVVRDARPDEAAAAAASCRPWPWLLVGAGSEPFAGLEALLELPVLALWYGAPPPGVERRAQAHTRFRDLVSAVAASLGREVAGMRLAVGAGVDLASGRHTRCAELQALVSAGPGGLALPRRRFRCAQRILTTRGLGARLATEPSTGRVSLRGGR